MNNHGKGYLWLTVSAMLFAVMAVAVRLAGIRGIPGSETTLARFLISLMVVAAIHATGADRVRVMKPRLLVARGVTGGFAILLYYLSLSSVSGKNAVPLTNSVFLGNSYFLYTPIFGALLIRERVRTGTLAMVGLALVGLYLVADPNLRDLRLGNVYGFAAGVIAGFSMVLLRELRMSESALSAVFSLSFFGALFSGALLFSTAPVSPDSIGWLLLVVAGATGTAAQLMFSYAMRFAGASEGSLVEMSTIVYSSLVGVLFLGDPFTMRTAVGGLLVLAAAVYISLCSDAWKSAP
ncbi:MAG: DMT family transporter [Armatimonadota bacterium]